MNCLKEPRAGFHYDGSPITPDCAAHCMRCAARRMAADIRAARARRVAAEAPKRIERHRIDAFASEIISVGVRVLAHKYHPDIGGKQDDMQLLNLAAAQLRDATAERTTI